jgi:hypothetical protein
MNHHSVSPPTAVEAAIHIKALARRYTFLGIAGLAPRGHWTYGPVVPGLPESIRRIWRPGQLRQRLQLPTSTKLLRPTSTNCDTALFVRRAWAIPAVAIGWLLVTGFLLAWVHREPKEGASSA